MSELKYEEVYPQSRGELEAAFTSDNPAELRAALYSAAKYECDWRWTQAQGLKFLIHADSSVRWAAALSLGYIALYRRNLDLDKVLPALHEAKAKTGEDPHVASAIQDALEMILHYIRPN